MKISIIISRYLKIKILILFSINLVSVSVLSQGFICFRIRVRGGASGTGEQRRGCCCLYSHAGEEAPGEPRRRTHQVPQEWALTAHRDGCLPCIEASFMIM